MSLLRRVSRWVAVAAATTLLASIPALAAAQDSVAAVWVPKQVSFVYQGFTARFSCDGLRDQIRVMLQQLGAHELEVRAVPCARGSGVPSPFPGVRVTMQVLVPASSADAAKAKSAAPPLQAQWQEVVLMGRNEGIDEQGKCELIEQFRRTFLPLFATRNVQYQANCIPHQITLGTHLSAEVLVPPARREPR